MSEIGTQRVLWASMFATVGFFALAASHLPQVPAPSEGPIPIVFAALALGNAVMSFVVPSLVFKTGAQKAGLKVKEVPDPNAAAGFGAVTRVRVFEEPAKADSAARLLHRQTFILALALSESIGVFGFVLNRLGHPPLIWLPFILVSGLLIALRFPREDLAQGRLERAVGARFVA